MLKLENVLYLVLQVEYVMLLFLIYLFLSHFLIINIIFSFFTSNLPISPFNIIFVPDVDTKL